MKYLLILLLFFSSYFTAAQAGLAIPSQSKFKIIQNLLDTLSKKESINLHNKDSNSSLDILIDCNSYDLILHGDLLAWRINFDTAKYDDTAIFNNLYNCLENRPFVNIDRINVSNIDLLINGQVGGYNFGNGYKELKHYAAIIIEKPAYYSWGLLDILSFLCENEARVSEYRKFNSRYTSFVLEIPITVIKSFGESRDNKLQVEHFLFTYHVFSNKDFTTINYKLEKIIPLGDLWRK